MKGTKHCTRHPLNLSSSLRICVGHESKFLLETLLARPCPRTNQPTKVPRKIPTPNHVSLDSPAFGSSSVEEDRPSTPETQRASFRGCNNCRTSKKVLPCNAHTAPAFSQTPTHQCRVIRKLKPTMDVYRKELALVSIRFEAIEGTRI